MNDVAMKSITMGDSRKLEEDGKVCTKAESLLTPLDVDVTAFGTMFTIVTKDDPIDILALEFFANPTAKTLQVEIYTKLGDYKGFEDNSTVWEKIANIAIAAPPSDRHSLLIPMSDFKAFTMNPNELRAMFITLQTSDLRYKYGSGLQQGQTFYSDGYLSVNVGIGHANYGFGKRIFPARLFSGAIHYSHHADCTMPRSKSMVHFTYYTRPRNEAMKRIEMVNELDRLVRKSISDILNEDMLELREEKGIMLESIETDSSIEHEEQEKCPVNGWSACVKLESKVTLSHLKSIQSGYLQYLLLEKYPQVTEHAQTGSIQVFYGGRVPIKAEALLAFKGVPSGPINLQQQLFIEEVTTKYLSEETVGLSNAVVIGAKITHQRGPSFKEERIATTASKSLIGKSLIGNKKAKGPESKDGRNDWIELRMDVLGTVKPPYSSDVGFNFVVKKAFNQDEAGYIYSLQREHIQLDPQGDDGKADYFVGINQILARLPMAKITFENKEKILGLSEWHFITACTGLLISGILSYLYVLRRTARNRKKSNSNARKLMEKSQMLAMSNEMKSSRTLGTFASSVKSVSSSGAFPSGGRTIPAMGQIPSQSLVQPQQYPAVPPQQFPYVPPQQFPHVPPQQPPPDFRQSISREKNHRTDGGGSSRGSGGLDLSLRGSRSLIDSSVRSSVRSSDDRSVRSSGSRSVRSSGGRSVGSSDDRSVRSSGSRSVRSSVSRSVRSSDDRSVRSSGSRGVRSSVSSSGNQSRSSRRPSSRERQMQGDGLHRKDPSSRSSRSSEKTSLGGKRSNGILS